MKDNLFDLVSLYRLGEKVRERVSAEVGRRISRNTMQLALENEPTTPLRAAIRSIAVEEIRQHEAIVAALRRLDPNADSRLKNQMEEMGHGHAAMLVS